jgi:hypothetical protein
VLALPSLHALRVAHAGRHDRRRGAAERLAIELDHPAGRGLVAIVRESDPFLVDREIPLTGLVDEVRALRPP